MRHVVWYVCVSWCNVVIICFCSVPFNILPGVLVHWFSFIGCPSACWLPYYVAYSTHLETWLSLVDLYGTYAANHFILNHSRCAGVAVLYIIDTQNMLSPYVIRTCPDRQHDMLIMHMLWHRCDRGYISCYDACMIMECVRYLVFV